MDNKIIIEVLADIPIGFFWGIKKLLEIITCWALKRRIFYNIVSECLEKGGKKIMNAVNLKEDIIETVEKGNRGLKKRLEAIAKNSKEDKQELKEGNRELKQELNILRQLLENQNKKT